MARSVNKVILLGNLGKDPELRSTQTGTSVCSFSLATSESYKDRNGEWQENTDWHNIVMWDRQAENAAKYLKKGSKVYLEGKIRTRSYEQDGITKYKTEVIAFQMVMLDPKEQSGSYSPQGEQSAKPTAQGANNFDLPDTDEDDDDIPF